MRPLIALDLPLGPDLETALRECVDREEAFCVLDGRLAPRRRAEQLALFGATVLHDTTGRTAIPTGEGVDPDIGLVMATSGSSGPPKAAELSWGALRASAAITQATLRDSTPPAWYPCLPANHIGGLAVLLRAILDDATLVWGDAKDLEAGAARGATHVSVVRAQLVRHDLSGYQRVLLGGARPPFDLPSNVITTWGMTETGSGVVYDGLPLPGVEIAAVDGQILVRTPTLFTRYRHGERPRATGPDGRDDWFPTGDAGSVENGRLSVRGRLGYQINTGGEKLWPEDLEAVLVTVEGVRDVAVTSLEDPEWGERVVVLVVDDGRNLDGELRRVAEERIGPWAKPKEIRHVVAVPRTHNGKIRRDVLRDLR